MAGIVEYNMTNGTKESCFIDGVDDEADIREALRDDRKFVSVYKTLRSIKCGELHESPATVWLNKAHIKTVVIKDEEAD